MPSASPRAEGRVLALLLTLALLAGACTGSGESTPESDGTGQPTPSAADGGAAPADGGGEVADGARTWLADTYGLDDDVLDGLAVAEVTASPGVQHVRFAQTADGLPVVDGEITVHVLDSGEVQSATDDLVTAAPGDADGGVDEGRALDVATKAVTGTPTGDPAVEQAWVQNGDVLQLVWRVEVATTEPVSSWVVLVDAAAGQVLSAERATFGLGHDAPALAPGTRALASAGTSQVAQAAADACDVPSPGACVFLPDPVYAAGGRLDDPRSANDFLSPVELQGLDDPSALVGEFVDTEPPGVPVTPVQEDDGTWAGGRATPGFEAAMAYYWIDRVQRQIQDLGFSGVLDEPFGVYPVDPDTVDNAFYSPAERRIHLGVGSDGINEGEDAAGIVHEYGHAVLDAQAPSLLGSVEGGAYHESFGDLLAFLTQLEHRTGDVGCLFSWTEEGQCLRRIDSDKVYPDDVVNEVHLDGEIYNGAIYDVTEALLEQSDLAVEDCPGTTDCAAVTDRVLTTLLASNTYLPNDPTLPDVAEAFLLANDAVFDGEDADVIAEALAAHGLTGGGQSMVDAGGDAIGTDAAVVLQVDVTHSYRGDLDVTAGVAGPDGEDLCEPIQLATPDEADDADNLIGEVDVSDSDCAGLVPPGPDQAWYLHVVDTLAADEGQINGFTVVADEAPYLAAGLPVPIADADPSGTFAFVAGAGHDVQPEGMGSTGMGDGVTGDGPVLTVEISHSYVGDLGVSAGVVDADSQILCSVTALEPDPSDASGEGVGGDIDLSDCAGQYPPSPDRRWYLLVTDTAAIDTGTVDQMTLTGPDGRTYDFADVPVDIPDADPDGVALLLDGDGGASGQAGGGGAAGDLTASVTISHPYRGDLAVTAGVLAPDGTAACEVVVHAPDQSDAEDGLDVEVPLADCARHYPPTPEQPWYVFAADTLAADTGTLDAVAISGPDGTTFTATGLPLDLPDADPDGVVVLLDGSEATGGGGVAGGTIPAGADVRAEVRISHPFVGDLGVVLGVAGADGTVRCEQPVRDPDPQDGTDDLAVSASFGDCGAFYPPAPDAVFYLEVVDRAPVDVGSIDGFTVIGPDGTAHPAARLPVGIPDAEPSGEASPVVVGVDR